MCAHGEVSSNSPGIGFLKHLCVLLFSVIAASGIAGQVTTSDITALELNKGVYRDLSGGYSDRFQVALKRDEFARLVVEQHGIDVVVQLIGTDGKAAVIYDADPRNEGEETVEFASKEGGNMTLAVEPRLRSAATGQYEIRLAEIRNATEKDLALDEARRLQTEVNRLYFASEDDAALPLAQKLVDIREKQLGPDDPEYGTALFVLGNIYNDKGDFDRAEQLYTRAISIREKALGKDHFSLAPIYNNLGLVYKGRGDYFKAEEYYNKVLSIRQKILDPLHPALAGILNNLGTIASARGDKDKAKAYYLRVLEIREKSIGPESADVATVLNNIANLYNDIPSAEPYYQRALAIREKIYGPEGADVAQTLYNIAVMYSSNGDYARAAPICQRSLDIFEKKLGEEHPYVSYSLNLLAVIYKNLGDYAKAEALYQRAIAIKEKTQPFHPDLGGSYANLANLYALKGDTEKAIEYQSRANRLLEYNIALNLAAGSEKEKLAYIGTFANIENQSLTLGFEKAPDSLTAAELGVTTVLQRKGRVLDSLSDNLLALRRRSGKDDLKLLDDLNQTTSKLVGSIVDGPGDTPLDAYRKQIGDLESRRSDLEDAISKQSTGSFERSKPVTLADVRAVVPADSALVEFALYRPVSPKYFEFSDENSSNTEAFAPARYAVYVITRNGDLKWKDLGETQKIDDQIAAFRDAIRNPLRKDVAALARAVDESVMRPIRTMVGNAAHLLISPDGELDLLPFEALVDESGRYLVERYSITYLTSGRDLLRMQQSRTSKEPPLIIADPAFGPAESVARSGTSEFRRAGKKGKSSIVITRDLNDTYFAPLSGTAEEAKRIKALFPQARILTGADASETALKSASAPVLLHLATHGFFLENEETQNVENTRATERLRSSPTFENPLLRSGIALAGANHHAPGGDNGILTALEASGLNLSGTKLVVLSACDTGLGEVRNGEGVYGLRRAFVEAGAESLVMSLWPVSDYVTRELMTGYYKNLKAGMGRGESLRQVQLEMIRSAGRSHPFYWASFIESGEWANLDGKR